MSYDTLQRVLCTVALALMCSHPAGDALFSVIERTAVRALAVNLARMMLP